jgi:uncharacterized protein involved in exopolysaccharide biosynthesis
MMADALTEVLSGSLQAFFDTLARGPNEPPLFRLTVELKLNPPPTTTTTATLPQQQLSEMNTQLSTAKSAQADAEAKARLIRDALAAGRPLEISEIANNELVRKLSADRATLRAQVALESRTLLPGHPRMKELTAQLANVEADIRASAEKAVRTQSTAANA